MNEENEKSVEPIEKMQDAYDESRKMNRLNKTWRETKQSEALARLESALEEAMLDEDWMDHPYRRGRLAWEYATINAQWGWALARPLVWPEDSVRIVFANDEEVGKALDLFAEHSFSFICYPKTFDFGVSPEGIALLDKERVGYSTK